MKSIAKLVPTLFIPAAMVLTACDPGYFGETFVQNDTSDTLRLMYNANAFDTVVMDIAPNTTLAVREFGGVKAGKNFSCCPCEFMILDLQPTDSSKTLGKDINDPDQWILDNPNKSVFHNKEIRCTFTVTEADIH